jgi:hypothetical protein
MILSVREQIEESKAALIYASDQVSAYLAFRHWIATEEGQRLWQATCPKLSWICISHALAQTKATCFGLLLTQRGAIIWSKYSHRAFTRRHLSMRRRHIPGCVSGGMATLSPG